MSGQGLHFDRQEERRAGRFAHEGGTRWAGADKEKKSWISTTGNVDEEMLKGLFGQNKKQNTFRMCLGRTRRDDPVVITLVDEAGIHIFSLSNCAFLLEKPPRM